jgi:uncharacterized protein (DUF362 family)
MPSIAIAYTKERHRSFERVLSLVREALEHLGGMAAFVRPGQNVLIKPNQSAFSSADEGGTTDPLVVGSLIRLAQLEGAARIQVAGSSDASSNSLECMQGAMAEIAEREGAETLDLGSDRVPNREVDLPEGKVVHRVPLPVPLLEADVIIAVPKAKNGHLDRISGAMELWMDVVNQTWCSRHVGDNDTIGRFADIMTVTRPDLSVTDALICGEGDGPLANLPHWCGSILASADPVATDIAIARLMGLDWTKLRFAAAGEERGIGSREPLVWLGTPLERIAFQTWPGHEGHGYLPVNFLVQEGAPIAGTYGHVKSALDLLLRRGILEQVLSKQGTPTVMVGDVADPEFERHVQEGPYLVFDDAARSEYKNDPRVFFVPGHPVLHTAVPQLMEGLRVRAGAGNGWRAGERRTKNLGHGQVRHALTTAAAPSALAAIAFGAMIGIRALAGKPRVTTQAVKAPRD